MREKRSSSSGSFGGIASPKRPNLGQVKSIGSFATSTTCEYNDHTADMIAAFKDDAQASKDVINVLKNEVEKLELENVNGKMPTGKCQRESTNRKM